MPSTQGSQTANQQFESQPGNRGHGSWERGIRRGNPEPAIALHVGRAGGSVGSPRSSRDAQNVGETLVGPLRGWEELRKRRAAKPGAARLRSGLASAGRVLAGHVPSPRRGCCCCCCGGKWEEPLWVRAGRESIQELPGWGGRQVGKPNRKTLALRFAELGGPLPSRVAVSVRCAAGPQITWFH